MSNVADILAQAKAHHGQGRLADAAELYRRVLASDAAHADAHYLLGTACHALGQPQDAIANLTAAVRENPSHAEAHHYLGYVLEEAGQTEQAIASYQQAQRLKPTSADITKNLRRALATQQNNAGNALAAAGQWEQAVTCFQRAIELKPDFAEAFYHLGNTAVNQGRLDEAAAHFRRAIELKSDFTRAYNNLAVALTRQNKLAEAAECCHRAIGLDPNFADAHTNLGRVLRAKFQLNEAAECCRRAIALEPLRADPHNTLALVLRDQGKPSEAQVHCRRALELKPDFPRAANNLALVLRDERRFDEALGWFDRALELAPDFAEAHLNRGLTLLLLGRWADGWSEYEWRWRVPTWGAMREPQLAWDGSTPAGRTVLVYAEQGLGDTLQFIRYVPLLESRGARVIVEVQAALIPLLAGSGYSNLRPASTTSNQYDVHVALPSLPGIFHTDVASVPWHAPYLLAQPSLMEHWRQKLAALTSAEDHEVQQQRKELKIGIAWQGRPDLPPWREIPLAMFEGLARLPGVRLISLQKGLGCEQLTTIADRFAVVNLGSELDADHGPFMDTAALMTQLDLVITADTATAHLAGGLGVPVWVALPYVPDWRWLLDRTETPWYPTMRLFRQIAPGDWHGVFAAIVSAVLKLRD